MKQIIILITILLMLTIIALVGCSSQTSKASGNPNSTCVYVSQSGHECQVYLINVRGHEYLLSYTSSSYGGTCIIHAAHCPCQNKQK